MKSVFNDHVDNLFGEGSRITDCTILDARYKTFLKPASWQKSRLSVSYQLQVTDPGSGAESVEILYAQVYLGNHSSSAYPALQAGSHPAGCAVHLPAVDMVVWRFPGDPVLTHLSEATDLHSVVHHLPFGRMPGGVRSPKDLSGFDRKIIRYKPGKCCTTQFEFRRTDPPLKFTLIGKTLRNDRKGQDVYARMQSLWDVHKRSPDRITVAEPLGYAEPIKTVWQKWVEGQALASVLNVANYERYLGAAAKGLATVHASVLSSPLRFTVDDHLAETRKKCMKLANAFPQFGADLAALVRRLEMAVTELPESQPVLIYGDFHIDQLLLHADQVVFLDFDSFAISDPEQDLAEFVVDLRFRGFEAELVQQMCTSFVDSYRSEVKWPITQERLDWHTLVQLVAKAYHLYVRLGPDLDRTVDEIISATRKF